MVGALIGAMIMKAPRQSDLLPDALTTVMPCPLDPMHHGVQASQRPAVGGRRQLQAMTTAAGAIA